MYKIIWSGIIISTAEIFFLNKYWLQLMILKGKGKKKIGEIFILVMKIYAR